MSLHLDNKGLEELRSRKQTRPFFRLVSSTVVEHEYRRHGGHTSYAFVRFECKPAYDLSFDVGAQWPSTVPEEYRTLFEFAIAEGIADILLDGLYQHRGCAVTLTGIGYDEIESSEQAFMIAARRAMEDLLKAEWTA